MRLEKISQSTDPGDPSHYRTCFSPAVQTCTLKYAWADACCFELHELAVDFKAAYTQATPAPNRKIYIVPPLTFSASATWQVDHRGIPYYWLAHCNLYGGDDAGYPWYLDTSTFLTDTNGGGLRKCPPEI